MKMMTRRSFLKITGALALAVGAAGALSGCDAVDNAGRLVLPAVR